MILSMEYFVEVIVFASIAKSSEFPLWNINEFKASWKSPAYFLTHIDTLETLGEFKTSVKVSSMVVSLIAEMSISHLSIRVIGHELKG